MGHEATVRGLGMSPVGEGEGTPVMLLEARESIVPVFVSAGQAQSIKHALEGEPFERPLTHDLLVEMVTELGGAVDRVRVDDLADGTFYAKVDVEEYRGGDRRELTFDARPSDAIAVALRVECPIRVSEEVLEEAGRPPEEFDLA